MPRIGGILKESRKLQDGGFQKPTFFAKLHAEVLENTFPHRKRVQLRPFFKGLRHVRFSSRMDSMQKIITIGIQKLPKM